jgi:hypothetical protein
VCKPKEYVGLGILNVAKFSLALWMRWLWNEWKDKAKPWIGLENSCTTQDKQLFVTAIKVTNGDGKRASFWETPWLDGRRRMDIAPLVYERLKRKNAPSTRHYRRIFGSPNSTPTMASHLTT